MKVKTVRTLEDWPIVKTETNRERIIRALREAQDVVPQCKGALRDGDARCALGLLLDETGGSWPKYGWCDTTAPLVIDWNNIESLTFAQIADRLEADDSYWNEKADEQFTVR